MPGDARARIEAALERLSATGLDGVPPKLLEPIRYALEGAGKRLRPLLCGYAYEAAGGKADIAPLAISIELIHTYSLVHDDLPCMDDDDFRRGRPTLHKRFDPRRAMLAGAALIPIAARTIVRAGRELGFDDARCSELATILFESCGASGMIGGQLLDLTAERRSLGTDELESLHRAKTGALIGAAVKMGAVAAQATSEDEEVFETFGNSLGLAFQIMDDVSDVTRSSAAMGKTTGRDTVLGKSTYPGLLGVEQARHRAEELIRQGTEALSRRSLLTANLDEVANLMLARNG